MRLVEWFSIETEEQEDGTQGEIEFQVVVETDDISNWEIVKILKDGEPYDPTDQEQSDMDEMADEWAKDAETDYFNDMREMFNDD
jgi:uncharacterized phage-associated protein